MGMQARDERFLICRSAGHWCALPLASVREIMRPLPLERLASDSSLLHIVQGAAIVRGAIVPVLNLAGLLGGSDAAPVGRFVSLRLDGRAAVLAVEAVLGIHELPDGEALAPLLGAVEHEAVAAIRMHDQELLFVLQAAQLVPQAAWDAVAGMEAA